VRAEQTHRFSQLVLDDLDKRLEIAVIRDHNGDLELVRPSIVHEVHGEVDVGPLLLAVVDLHEARHPRNGIDERSPDRLRKEATVDDLNLGNRCERS
jgi:hypothetical protein